MLGGTVVAGGAAVVGAGTGAAVVEGGATVAGGGSTVGVGVGAAVVVGLAGRAAASTVVGGGAGLGITVVVVVALDAALWSGRGANRAAAMGAEVVVEVRSAAVGPGGGKAAISSVWSDARCESPITMPSTRYVTMQAAPSSRRVRRAGWGRRNAMILDRSRNSRA